MATSLFVIFLYMAAMVLVNFKSQKRKFKAAVYEHAVIRPTNTDIVISRAQALVNMYKNLAVYREQAQKAKLEGADIIVFPEDGLYGYVFKRETVAPYLETIPDPKNETWSPCVDSGRYENTDILRSLSCIAKDNSLYLVANMGDKQPCRNVTDPKCPADGWYQYNTDVAFGPDGTLLARYHKYNLYHELQFDRPPVNVEYFDTPFGRFGLMICFDVLFYEPAVAMVLQHNISNIAFTTAWRDSLPILSAIGFHSSFARALGVNFLSANLHLPGLRFQGSGIYTAEGAKTFYYGARNDSSPKLLVAELDVLGRPEPNIETTHSRLDDPRSKNVVSRAVNAPDAAEFTSVLSKDAFTFRTLDSPSGSIRVCQKEVCCSLNFSIDPLCFGNDLYAFGAFDGPHAHRGEYYLQVCTLVKCAQGTNKTSCGTFTYKSSTNFLKIEMRAELPTRYIYPQVVLSNHEGELGLADDHTWGFHVDTLNTSPSFNATLLSATLLGRNYPRDHEI